MPVNKLFSGCRWSLLLHVECARMDRGNEKGRVTSCRKSHAAFLCRGPTLRASGEKVKSRQPNFVGSEDLGKCEGHHLQPYSLKKHLHLSIMLLPDSAPVGKRGHFASVFPKIDLESASSNSRFINGTSTQVRKAFHGNSSVRSLPGCWS